MMEEIDWSLEFEKIKDKDNIDAIIEDSWFLSDNDLMARVVDLFDLSAEVKPENETLTSKHTVTTTNNNNEREGKKRKVSIMVNDHRQSPRKRRRIDTNRVDLNETLKIPYAQRIEMAKQKLQQSYARCKDSRKHTCLIGVNEVPIKKQCISTSSRVNKLKDAKSSGKRQTCLVGVDDVVPKKPCQRELRDVYKTKKVESRLSRNGLLPVSRAMRGY
ncbi:hypothetical protein RND81_02G055500 [Saponaria officinalis]|uniref:Uncharacterized protein n=1 Tax=Saponaria officinalis TaxID=3572 RepID=A0AAW1MKS7_SAPOF